MAEDKKEPQAVRPPDSESSASETPSTKNITDAGEPPSADAEKAAMVEQAKTRVAAAKESIAEKAAPDVPKPPVKKKEEGPKPTDASAHALVKELKEKFAGDIKEATEFLGQLSIRVSGERIVEICDYLRQNSQARFNYLSDLTCVHYPLRTEAAFDVVYNLYSITANERVRLYVGTNDSVATVTDVWPAANWMEREVYDLFGVTFTGHPDLRRILLPADWEGHPLRKDYALEFVENQWTEQHLPEFTDVQREQLEQRRAYGLEILSVPEERMMREILQQGKEVMPKDK